VIPTEIRVATRINASGFRCRAGSLGAQAHKRWLHG